MYRLITEIILGTDMAVHSKILAQARVELANGDFWQGPDAEGRLLAMKVLMHTADISNAGRPASKAGMWTRAVYDEFFKQGDAEKEMQLDVSPLCDRDSVAIAESQVRFPAQTPTRHVLRIIKCASFCQNGQLY